MSKGYDIIIPTRDSGAHLEIIAQFYNDKELSPLFIVDQRTSDNTREIIQKNNFRFTEFLPRGNFPEAGMIEFGAQNCSKKWILRLDDDELPTDALLNWIERRGTNSKNQAWYLPRRELYASEAGIVYSRSPGKYPIPAHPDKHHPMARLFHVDRVKYLEEVHTTGFEEFLLYSFAPQNTYFIHLNCLVHNQQRRLEKLEEYETISPGSSYQLADEYLPELFESELHNPSQDGLEEFEGVLRKLSKVIANKQALSIGPDKKELLSKRVCERAASLALEQEKSEQYNCDADWVYWTEHLPLSLRWTLAKLLCTLGTKKTKHFGITMWNYINFYEDGNY